MITPIETKVYQRAELDIEILFPMVTTRLTQIFSNPSEKVIEAIYQFPVPSESVLGDIEVSINKERFTGVIKKKNAALQEYEEAVSDGKRAVILNDLGDGLMELNAGNLASGDELSVALTIHSFLEALNGQVRYHMPTCIAPRYGASPFDYMSTPTHNFFAAYPFTANVSIHKDSGLRVVDSTHELDDSGQGMRFKGILNQDISLQFQRIEDRSYAYSAEMNQQCYSVACFHLLPVPLSKKPSYLQLIVDCSGSMGGRSIGQVRKGLSRAFESISHDDQVNLIRFGSTVDPVLNGLRAFEGKHRDTIEEIALGLDADLGGTEIVGALEVGLAQLKNVKQSSIVLLTDGQVWEERTERVEGLLAQASAQGVRIFCIGVGDNIDDAFLQKLASQTQGRLYRANPHEDLARIVSLAITQAKQKGIKAAATIDGYTIWTSPLDYVLAGEYPTVSLCTSSQPQGVVLESDTDSFSVEPKVIPKDAHSFERALIKLCTHQRIRGQEEEVAARLAEQAQIISAHTSFILTTEEQVKGADGFPTVVQVPQSVTENYLDEPTLCRRLEVQDSGIRFRLASGNSDQSYKSSDYDDDPEFQPWIEFARVERYLNRRVFKVQSLDFDFIRLCGASDFIAQQLEELYIYVLQEGDEVFTVDSFVARFILFDANKHGYVFKGRVKARLEALLWDSTIDLEEFFGKLDATSAVFG